VRRRTSEERVFLVFLIIYDTMHLSPRRGEFKFLDRQKGVFVKKGRRKGKNLHMLLFDVTAKKHEKFSFVKKMNQHHHSSSTSSAKPPTHNRRYLFPPPPPQHQ
jgi:hypothetical protein